MKTLTKEQVLYLHAELIEEFGGADGIRDMGLLELSLIHILSGAGKKGPGGHQPHSGKG